MKITIEVSERVAERLARIPEGEARDGVALLWLERGLGVGEFSDEEIAEASTYTDEQDRLLAQGIAASEAGHTRPAMNSFLDFLKRREQERKALPGQGVK
ncbi:MAG: hypothetical protein H8F28_05990 [Fibrella sp.]|nr:hypothetical protein [Armatimonadota bacterium]